MTKRTGENHPVEQQYVICTLTTARVEGKPSRLRRISIHVKGCEQISLTYNRRLGSSDDVSRELELAARDNAQQAISCRGCGGWTVD